MIFPSFHGAASKPAAAVGFSATATSVVPKTVQAAASTFTAGSDWNPADYGTVVAWYNETSAITGTTDVTQWNDISGNGRHATKQGGTYNSTVATVNGKRVFGVTTGRGMMIPDSSAFTSSGAALIVFVTPNPLVDLMCVFGNAVSGATTNPGFTVRTRTTQVDYLGQVQNGSAAWLAIGGADAAAGALTVLLCSWDGAVPRLDVRVRMNAFVENREDLTVTGSAPASANQTRFGGLSGGVAFDGTLCEAVAWTAALSTTNQANALSAAATRWGLALS